MYVRQYGFVILPGQEERAAALCVELAGVLRERGVEARVLVSEAGELTLHVAEEYADLARMRIARALLERDQGYREAVTGWAACFYPLVRSSLSPIMLREQGATEVARRSKSAA